MLADLDLVALARVLTPIAAIIAAIAGVLNHRQLNGTPTERKASRRRNVEVGRFRVERRPTMREEVEGVRDRQVAHEVLPMERAHPTLYSTEDP